MKKMLFAIVSCLLFFSSFKYLTLPEKSNPKDVAYNFVKAIDNMEFATAKKYSTEETSKLVDFIADIYVLAPDSVKEERKKSKVEAKDVIENGNECTVTLLRDKEEDPILVNLIKVNDVWKVQISKEGEKEPQKLKKTKGIK